MPASSGDISELRKKGITYYVKIPKKKRRYRKIKPKWSKTK
jgi:hypothetical protein